MGFGLGYAAAKGIDRGKDNKLPHLEIKAIAGVEISKAIRSKIIHDNFFLAFKGIVVHFLDSVSKNSFLGGQAFFKTAVFIDCSLAGQGHADVVLLENLVYPCNGCFHLGKADVWGALVDGFLYGYRVGAHPQGALGLQRDLIFCANGGKGRQNHQGFLILVQGPVSQDLPVYKPVLDQGQIRISQG